MGKKQSNPSATRLVEKEKAEDIKKTCIDKASEKAKEERRKEIGASLRTLCLTLGAADPIKRKGRMSEAEPYALLVAIRVLLGKQLGNLIDTFEEGME